MVWYTQRFKMKEESTTIKLRQETKKRLDRLKEYERESYEEVLRKIEKVSQNDILRTGREIFRPAKANLAIIGRQGDDKKDEEQYKKILRTT